MARRIEIELTSDRGDGSWTWRAAGAREPRGVVEVAVLPGAPSVGDVLRAEVDIGLDGTEITEVLPTKRSRSEPERLELLGKTLTDDELVTTRLAGRRGGGRDRDGGGRERRDGRDGKGSKGDGPRRSSRDGRGRPGPDEKGSREARHPREEGGRHERPAREATKGRSDRGDRRPPPDERPRPKRLRPRRTHRRAVVDTLEVHERPIADELLKGGIPAMRQAVEKQNAQARAEGRPEVDPTQLEGLAERLLPRLRAAEWRDRADAALADIEELDLRDLRTVVVAADLAARDEEARALATQLREGLNRRIEGDQAAWLAEMAQLLADGRVVRALRVSSRPPKAGAPLPTDLAARLIEGANASLTADTGADRWVTVLDALSLSPVHARVTPASVPAEPSDELKKAVAAVGDRVPLVAAALGIEPAPAASRGRGGARPGTGARGGRPPRTGAPTRRRVPPPPPPLASATDTGSGPPAAAPPPEPTASTADATPASGAEPMDTAPTVDAPPADQVPEPEADTTAAVPALAPGPSPEPPVADVTPSPETEPESDAASGSESDERPPPAASSGTSPHTT